MRINVELVIAPTGGETLENWKQDVDETWPEELTQWMPLSAEDQPSLETLIPAAYDELRVIASKQLRKGYIGRTLQTTALVNEACMHLIQHKKLDIKNKRHFFYFAARVMRHLLVNHVRRNVAAKRGGEGRPATLENNLDKVPAGSVDMDRILPLNDALARLEKMDARQARIVELRYFAGMTHEEIGEVLDISKRTVIREWNTAKLWLYRELKNVG